jgi:cell division protein FtsB
LVLDFYQKRKLKVFLGSRYIQLGVLGVTALVAMSAFDRYQTAVEMADRRAAAEQEAAALEARRASLEEQVDYLSNERGIEAEMRRQFDVAKDGEKVVVIVESEEEEPANEINDTTSSTTKQRWYEFWR